MEQQQLEGILKTTEGLEAVIRLLASLYYAPTGSDFFRFDHDPYTTKLRVFVRQVQSVIPESHHAKHSATCLEGLAEDSGNDLEEILHMAENLEAEAKHAQAIAKLEDLCRHLLTDPDQSEASTAE